MTSEYDTALGVRCLALALKDEMHVLWQEHALMYMP
jgi:hypothetical protein